MPEEFPEEERYVGITLVDREGLTFLVDGEPATAEEVLRAIEEGGRPIVLSWIKDSGLGGVHEVEYIPRDGVVEVRSLIRRPTHITDERSEKYIRRDDFEKLLEEIIRFLMERKLPRMVEIARASLIDEVFGQ